jgi:hypothetical protein
MYSILEEIEKVEGEEFPLDNLLNEFEWNKCFIIWIWLVITYFGLVKIIQKVIK